VPAPGSGEVNVRIYVRARGEASYGADFIFLGTGPQHWWKQYKDYVAVEKPGVLLHSDSKRWRAVLTGIRTSLRDSSGRGRPLNLALAGAAGEDDTNLAYAVIAAFLAEIGGDTSQPTVGVELQSRFTNDVIERLRSLTIVDKRPDEAAEEVDALVREAIEKLPVPERKTVKLPAFRSWAGDVTDARARDAFLARVKALLSGKPGLAATCNQTPTVAHVQPLGAEPGGATTLISGDPQLLQIVEITPARVEARPDSDPKETAGPVPAHPPLKLVIAAVIVAALAVIWWIIRR